MVPATILLLGAGTLLMPWAASVGNYGTLSAIPGQEVILRAPENAMLMEIRVRPGDQLASGAVVGKLGSLELEEQKVQVQSELARAQAEYDRLEGQVWVCEESAVRAEVAWRQRQYEYDEIQAEQQQIQARRGVESGAATSRVLTASFTRPALPASSHSMVEYPAAIAVLQADVELRQARLKEANIQLERARRLAAQGILPQSELEAAATGSATLAIELNVARAQLEAALVEHRRKHTSTATEMVLARAQVRAEQVEREKLESERQALQVLIKRLQQRLDLQQRRQAQFELVTPRAGAVFGEELLRMVGQYVPKGAEICRVADTRQLLVRIQVPEREIGDVQIGHPVRLKARAYPDRLFRGAVSKIGGESEPDQHQQMTYRVELTIDNREGLLRPGMTAFARIDFDRQMIGWILLHKLKQALRPELWML